MKKPRKAGKPASAEAVALLADIGKAREGVLVDSYSGTRFHLEIPLDDVCQKLASELNKEVILTASMRTRRIIEDSRLRDSLIVHGIRALRTRISATAP